MISKWIIVTAKAGKAKKILTEKNVSFDEYETAEKNEPGMFLIDAGLSYDENDFSVIKDKEQWTDACVTAETRTQSITSFMKETGIVRFLDYSSLELFPKPFAGIPVKDRMITHADNDPLMCSMISSISRLFGYRYIHAEETDVIIEHALKSQLLIHGISNPEFDFAFFVKHALHSSLKSIPYIPYLKKGEGIGIHHIQSGIGKLTKTIVNNDEALSVLIYNLFKYEWNDSVDLFSMNKDILGESGSFKELYHSRRNEFFAEKPCSGISNIIDSNKILLQMENMIALIKSVEWLLYDSPSSSFIGADV